MDCTYKATVYIQEQRFVEGEGWCEPGYSHEWVEPERPSAADAVKAAIMSLQPYYNYDIQVGDLALYAESNRIETTASAPDPDRAEDRLVDVVIWISKVVPMGPDEVESVLSDLK